MKKDDVNDMLNRMHLPELENIKHQQELKIPLLRYKKSAKAGFWLLIVPGIVAVVFILKYEIGVTVPVLKYIRNVFSEIDKNQFLTYLIPVIFIGFPLYTMIINMLAICHFSFQKESKELLVTIKYRVFNIVLFLISFAIMVYFLLPDKLSF